MKRKCGVIECGAIGNVSFCTRCCCVDCDGLKFSVDILGDALAATAGAAQCVLLCAAGVANFDAVWRVACVCYLVNRCRQCDFISWRATLLAGSARVN